MTYVGAGRTGGYGLLELMIAMIVAALLTALAVPAYTDAVERARIERAISEIGGISDQIERFRHENNNQYPGTLAALPIEIPMDPWGNEYRYLKFHTSSSANLLFRNYGKLNPLNSDFDLYSVGIDGESAGPLSAKKSRDDIVRANNGAFIGLGEDY